MAKNYQLLIPSSENLFLNAVLASVKSKRASLKQNAWEIKIERVIQEHRGDINEELNIRLQPSCRDAWMEIGIDDKRWVRLKFWECSEENHWQWLFEGRMLPIYPPSTLVETIEQNRAEFQTMARQHTGVFTQAWSRLLASGPKLVFSNE